MLLSSDDMERTAFMPVSRSSLVYGPLTGVRGTAKACRITKAAWPPRDSHDYPDPCVTLPSRVQVCRVEAVQHRPVSVYALGGGLSLRI
ncbi:hypothetical protein THIOKS1300004 [Thiocapsa sp. KS1]|nr:hypothetical protein THIOKS1300004 [Thiocapsa sp. KS1]